MGEALVGEDLAIHNVVEVALAALLGALARALLANVLVERLGGHVGGRVVVEDGAEQARLGRLLVADDGLHGLLARLDAQEPKEREDGHVHVDKGQRDDHLGRRALFGVGDVDVEAARAPQLALVARANLALQRKARGLLDRKHVGRVVVQLLLRH